MQYFRIYAKFSEQKSFKPLDLFEGVQVKNLIYATILKKDEAEKVLAELKAKYPQDKFEIREIESRTQGDNLINQFI